MSVTVHNIKISAKIPYRGLDVIQQCFPGPKKFFKNFFIVDDRFNFCFFKYSQHKSTGKRILGKHHVNITRIRNFEEIKEAIKILAERTNISISEIIHTTDNITATTKLERKIDIEKFQAYNKGLKIHLNLEKFPGLFVKRGFITLILFNSGKINFIGCNQLSVIEESCYWIKEKCHACTIQ